MNLVAGDALRKEAAFLAHFEHDVRGRVAVAATGLYRCIRQGSRRRERNLREGATGQGRRRDGKEIDVRVRRGVDRDGRREKSVESAREKV